MSANIQPQSFDNASEQVKKIFKSLESGLGWVPNLYRTIGQSGPALEGFLHYSSLLAKSSLTSREKEAVNLLVSELNGCNYCLSAHTVLASKADLKAAEIMKARRGISEVAREQAILDLTRKLVRTGGAGAGLELKRAKKEGVSDAEIVELLAIISLKHFTNLVAIVAGTEIDFPVAPELELPTSLSR